MGSWLQRIGEINTNNQGCLMKIVEYNNHLDIIVEFQDKYKGRVHTCYNHFVSGYVKNPYYPNVYGVGIVGNKYPSRENHKIVKEYSIWNSMLQRCFDKTYMKKFPTYDNVTCCEEWLMYENFYEWLHKQENFDKWFNGDKWAIDKDILLKGNKVYSPDNCCLVPHYINSLFIKNDMCRGELPVGVSKNGKKFMAYCNNPFARKREYLGTHKTEEQAFTAYKQYKESIIKQIAQIEYNKGNITKKCYEAMMNYEIEITD